MSGELIMAENYRVHERVGTLEQKVHTLEHRAESIEWIKPEVTKHGTLISEINANHRSLEKSFSRLSADVEELSERFDDLIAAQETHRIAQMQELHAIRVEQSNTNAQLRTAVKAIVLAGILIGALSNAGNILDRVRPESPSHVSVGSYQHEGRNNDN